MMTNPSIFRRAFDGVALFALLNLVAVGTLVAYLVGSGAVDGDKLRRITAVLREAQPMDEVEAVEKQTDAATEPSQDAVGGDVMAESQINVEIMRLESDRIKAELDQRLALNNSILLRVTTERDRFRRKWEEATRQQSLARQQRQNEGFRKQIAIYEALSPKVAVQHVLGLAEPDEAARVLLEMDTRKAKKIVEAAKDRDQMAKMKVILQRIREAAPDRLTALESNGR